MEASARELLAIVPARGGSKRLSNKNLRSLRERPLIAYTLDALLEAGVADRIVVSSDQDAILRWADLHGYQAHQRPKELATDESTISQVAQHLAAELDWTGDVGVFEPVSPFRSARSIADAVSRFRSADADSLGSCTREPYLYWLDEDDDLSTARPLFEERVNRQYARHPLLRETGSIRLVKAEALRRGHDMVTDRHLLFELDPDESLEIDSYDKLVVARRRVERGTVIFRLRANAKVGSGHVHHCLELADELADQRLRFLLRECDQFVTNLLDEQGYDWRTETDLAADLRALEGPGANLVVNDVLNTTEQEVLVERSAGLRVVNIEDLGPGAALADWVVNALYPMENGAAANVSSGPKYATLRAEFHDVPKRAVRRTPERVLITFGGTDPARLGPRCARLLADKVDADIRVIIGMSGSEEGFPEGVTVLRHVKNMAAEMMSADLILTSAGRTVYEAAAVGTPVAVLAQAARDATHAHLSYHGGVVFLGIGPLVDDLHVVGVVERLLADYDLRVELSERLRDSLDGRGSARIGHRIRAMLKGLDQ
jgi:CMP-N-acetylneuraminic acid synthetase/spore coat polysaccharide biosynthesis predicted glycosyltransferase SpsG